MDLKQKLQKAKEDYDRMVAEKKAKEPGGAKYLETLVLELSEVIRGNRMDIKKEEMNEMMVKFQEIVGETSIENKNQIKESIAHLQKDIDERIEKIEAIGDAKIKEVKANIPTQYDPKEIKDQLKSIALDYKKALKANGDLNKKVEKIIDGFDKKWVETMRKQNALNEKFGNLKVHLKHKDLEDIFPDDHHKELHIIESHSGLKATTEELNRLIDGSNADKLHKHMLPPAIITSGGGGVAGFILDEIYGATWDGDTTHTASRNALYDKIQAIAAGGIANVVEDLTPQLGGDLDLNGFNLDFPTTPNISDCLDEDNMASNSATKICTQQSIKAYVDTQIGTVNEINEMDDVNFTHAPANNDLLQYSMVDTKWYAKQVSELADFVDEDNMASNSATKVASQQSIKAYADSKLALTGGTISGGITFTEDACIMLPASELATDHHWSGIAEAGTAGETLVIGDLVSLHTDSKWYKVDANTAHDAAGDARRKLGICVLDAANANDPTTLLLYGKIRHDAFAVALLVGDMVYASETAGAVATTQPSTADVVIRVIGYGNTDDELFFNPSSDYITHT